MSDIQEPIRPSRYRASSWSHTRQWKSNRSIVSEYNTKELPHRVPLLYRHETVRGTGFPLRKQRLNKSDGTLVIPPGTADAVPDSAPRAVYDVGSRKGRNFKDSLHCQIYHESCSLAADVYHP